MLTQVVATGYGFPTESDIACLIRGLCRTLRPAVARSMLAGLFAVLSGSSTGTEDERDTEVVSPVPAARIRAVERAKTADILIVEDEGIVALDIKVSLRRMGHNVVGTVDAGHDAIVMAINRHPDIILMDIRLKGSIDGIEAAHAIHQIRPIPVIYLTGQLDEGTVRRAQATDPAGYLAKPFMAAELESLIQQVLDRRMD